MTAEFSKDKQELMTRLNGETSKIAWKEMQTFFASGNVVFVDMCLDLVDVASEFSLDNTQAFESWITQGLVGGVSDSQAQSWFEQDATVWAVVVAPWVLVQPVDTNT